MSVKTQDASTETDEISETHALTGGYERPLLELTRVLEERYSDLAHHGRSVSGYAAMTAHELGLEPRLVERVALAGELHDVGKVGVQDEILRKPGKLSKGEWQQIKCHPQVGSDLLYSCNLDDVALWVLSHHERPDGEGYPHGLAAEEIPVESRILAVADAYDAMRAERVYKAPMTHEEAATELLTEADAQFDGRVVETFLEALSRLGRPVRAAQR
ncbi:MAG: HD-GYP domain-containing protein [Solirubrobacterales bacterium]|nr:HD-GYP domain-containing protein [Solirubrobacterales bacterium]